MTAIATSIGTALLGMIVWGVNRLYGRLGDISAQLGNFESRIVRLESRAHWRLHDRVGGGH